MLRVASTPQGRSVTAGARDGRARRWWLVVDRGSVDLCLKDPAYPLDLKVTTDLRNLTAVWNGDLALRSATTAGSLRVEGPRDLVRVFPCWLALSPFAAVPAADAPSGGPSSAR